MYQLCIDQGNSSTKIGVFDLNTLIYQTDYKQFGEKEIVEIKNDFQIRSAIISSVISDNEDLLQFLQFHFQQFVILNHCTSVPIENKYHTPKTLGLDRLAAIVGAQFLQPEKNLLVIDAGTAITYDFLDKNKVYWGGNIAPGIEMRLKSLHDYTKKLPLIQAEPYDEILGNDTKTAILAGVIQGIHFEIIGYINTLKIKYPELSIFLTGGSTFYFDTKLKNLIFAEKNLVLIGLNHILNFNVQK
jgi:type III pantothenate kinase